MMSPEQFCYWIQGLMECKGENDLLTLKETQAIRDHLAIVFTKVTPDRSEPSEGEKRAKRLREARERGISNAISQTKRIC